MTFVSVVLGCQRRSSTEDLSVNAGRVLAAIYRCTEGVTMAYGYQWADLPAPWDKQERRAALWAISSNELEGWNPTRADVGLLVRGMTEPNFDRVAETLRHIG